MLQGALFTGRVSTPERHFPSHSQRSAQPRQRIYFGQEQDSFATQSVHAGQEPGEHDAVVPGATPSTIFRYNPGQPGKYDYTRTDTPTFTRLETALAALENGKHALVYPSGLGAETALFFSMLKPGDEIIASKDRYGGTDRLINQILNPFLGIKTHSVDLTDLNALQETIKAHPGVKLIYVENPTNPFLNVVDIRKITGIARQNGIKTCVDNTFSSPYLVKPLDLGADVVVESTTKYINGHSDATGGALITNDPQIAQQAFFMRNALGYTPSPRDVDIIQRGMKTLPLRVKQQCQNAQAIANFLESRPEVEKVIYPGLKSHPQHELAKQQMPKGYGGVVSFLIKGGRDEALRFMSSLRLFTSAVSLGSVESLVEYPAEMSHLAVKAEDKTGFTSLIRLAVGIEDADDLIRDLGQALVKSQNLQ